MTVPATDALILVRDRLSRAASACASACASAAWAVATRATFCSCASAATRLPSARSRFASRRDLRVGGRVAEVIFPLGRARGAVAGLAWGFVAVVLVVPLLALLSAALVRGYGLPLTAETLTSRHFEAALFGQSAIRAAFGQSLLLAGATAGLLVPVALALGWLAARRPSPATRVLGFSVEAAYALPGIVAAIAAILLFLKPLPLVGVSLYGTPWIILAAYLGHYGALVLRPVAGGMAQLDPALEEAAQVAGARTLRRLAGIVAPILAPAAAAGAILVFLTTLNEAQISILLVTSSSRTIGTTVYFLEESGSSSLAAAVGVTIVVIVWAASPVSRVRSAFESCPCRRISERTRRSL